MTHIWRFSELYILRNRLKFQIAMDAAINDQRLIARSSDFLLNEGRRMWCRLLFSQVRLPFVKEHGVNH